MVASGKDALFNLQLVIIKELLEKTRLRIFVELGAHKASCAVARTGLARGVNLNLLFICLVVATLSS